MKLLQTAVLALVAAVLMTVAVPTLAQAPSKPDLIEVLELKTYINETSARSIAEAVEKINENPKIKGVLFVVDTPGGGASASAVIYQELAKIKVPVVGYCEYVCASGGVYALMAPSVKYIAVRDDTIGGSVGVIMQLTRFHRLLDKLKVDNETYKSGFFKDAGNPTHAGNEAENKYLQSIVDTLAGKFYAVVTKARPAANMVEVRSAKIFIGEDIVKVGLADAVMTRDEVLKKVKELSGAKNVFTRDELRKLTKDASEVASMKPVTPPTDFISRAMTHLDTAMEIVAEVRSGESVRVEYRMPYRF